MDLLQREHPEILSRMGGVLKKWTLAYKSSNISETWLGYYCEPIGNHLRAFDLSTFASTVLL